MNRKAVIDVGSNSIKLLLCEQEANGSLKIVMDESKVTHMGAGLNKTCKISREAMLLNTGVISGFVKTAKAHGANEVACVGTMALRTAKNREGFVRLVKEACGEQLQIISGGEEARLSYLAILSWLPPQEDKLAIFDTGGGSTEFIFGKGKETSHCFSVDLGAIRVTESYFLSDPPQKAEIDKAFKEIDAVLAESGVNGTVTRLVGIGGTVTSMSAVKHKIIMYNPDIVHGSTLTIDDVDEQIKIYGSVTLEKRRHLAGLHPMRADTILAGTCIVRTIMSRLKMGLLTVSDRGLRHGVAFDMFASKQA